MKKDLSIVLLGLIACILLAMSFMFFFNDIINYSIICIAIVVLIVSYIIFLMFAGKSKKNSYNAKLKMLLKSYDSDIVYADSDYEIAEKNILFVKSLDDLLVASSITESPIIYIAEDKSSTFLVKNDEDLLAYILKQDNKVESPYELKLNKIIEENSKTTNSLLNNIVKETIIIIDNKSYKVTPVSK